MHAWGQLRQWRWRLGSKIFFLIFLSVSSLIFLLGYISQQFVKDFFVAQQTSYIQRLIEQRDLYLNQYMKSLRGDLFALSRDERLYTSKPYASDYLANFRTYWNTDIKNLYIVYPDGSISGTSDFLAELFRIRHIQSILAADSLDLAYPFYWTEPYLSPISDYTVSVVTHYRLADGTYAGSLIADLNLHSILAEYGAWNFLSDQDLLIVSAQNLPISTSHPYVSYDVFEKAYRIGTIPEATLDNISISSDTFTDASGNRMLFAKSQSNSWGWKVVAIVKHESLYQAIDVIRTYSWAVLLLGMLISLVLSFYLSRYIVRPVNLLIRQMDNVSRGDFQTRISLPYRDEIGVLARHFNQMVSRIKGLMEHNVQIEHDKKQYELKVLQAQIKPHFLYNTLNAVRFMAKNRDTDTVDHMVASLIELLRFHLDQVEELTPLSEELEGIRHYAYLMSVRYPNRFHLEIEADESVLGIRIPKFTIQPLVENSIFHGILPQEYGTIFISAEARYGELLLVIEDDGCGMSTEALKHIYERESEEQHGERYYHLGAGSIRERLRLYFGERATVRIESKTGAGTRIEISIAEGAQTYA